MKTAEHQKHLDTRVNVLILKRINNNSWRASSEGRTVSFPSCTGNPFNALESLVGWASWPLKAPMPTKIRAFIHANLSTLIERIEKDLRAELARFSLYAAIDKVNAERRAKGLPSI